MNVTALGGADTSAADVGGLHLCSAAAPGHPDGQDVARCQVHQPPLLSVPPLDLGLHEP